MTKDKIIEIFVKVDDFCQEYEEEITGAIKLADYSPIKRRKRASKFSLSEIITIMILFHYGVHRTFKHYYQQIVLQYQKDLFGNPKQ